jgi:hydrophobic/amphiphilic exporter-1 (mainly G- bacteria), HAE1 family
MDLARLSINRPVFITSILSLILVAGLIFMQRMPVDLFPDVTFPVVTVNVPYRGAGPAEIETLIVKPLENEISTISGLKRLSAVGQEGVGTVVAEFYLDIDIRYAEDQIRNAVTRAKRNMPNEIDEPIIRRIDPSDQPILNLALKSNMKPTELFDFADEVIRPQLEQVRQVGLVEVLGGRKREIQVILDRNKLKAHEVSTSQVAQRIQASGENVPIGKTETKVSELVYRSMGEFPKIEDISSVIVNFFGNDVPVTVKDVGIIKDTVEDEKSRTYVNGEKSLFLLAYKQSGSNTTRVVDDLMKKINKINADLKASGKEAELLVVRDGSKWIHANIVDVTETIIIGVLLAIIVVYLFLGSGRSTFITSLALPNSMIGAFILMSLAGFSINLMSLLALTLAVGLLVDDAIVVRENIFRHLEMGKSPLKAAIEGTGEVRLAVIATTFTVIAVFGPVGFLSGVVGQFFKEFGLTVCFAMIISLLDAMTVAPMLSAYMASSAEHDKTRFMYRYLVGPFDRFQTRLENAYVKVIKWVLNHPIKTIGGGFAIFVLSLFAAGGVTKTFLPPQDAGEFLVSFSTPPGTSLEKTDEILLEVVKVIRSNPEVRIVGATSGNRDGDATVASAFVELVPRKQRNVDTSQFKARLRDQLKPYAEYTPQVKDYDAVGGGMRPFTLNIVGTDSKELEKVGLKLFEKLKKYPKLLDPDVSFRPGKPEFQVQFIKERQEALGVSSTMAGAELRAQVDGIEAAKFRENDREYDIRVRLQEDQRDLKNGFSDTYIPNINGRLVPISRIANPVETVGPSKITRQDRNRYVQLTGDIAPGAGFGDILADVKVMLEKEPDTKLADGMTYMYIGQAENFEELGASMIMAMGLGILFIYLVLASLYESFVTPFTIMLALPLAIAGSFFALYITRESLNIFSWIGVIMLLGVSTKNSILLVDYANQELKKGATLFDAIVEAGRVRLRPIIMTTMALVAGTIPLAIGLNEASKQRTSMGIAIVGGLISSTLLTLIVIPAAYSFVERFRRWSLAKVTSVVGGDGIGTEEEMAAEGMKK